MTPSTEGRPRPARLLLYVGIAAVSSLVAMLPGLDRDNGSTSAIDIRSDAPARPSPTLPPKTATPITIAIAAPALPPVESAAAAPAPRLSLSPSAVNLAPAPTRLPDAGTAVPFSWPLAAAVAPPTPTPITLPPRPLRPVLPPATGVYLGAYPDPFATNGDSTIQEILIHLPEFNTKIGRNLAIVSVYQPWASGWVLNDNLTQIADSQGAIPMVSWRCGETNERLMTGASDALIFQFAEQLKAYGRPVLLRWFWEANFLNNELCHGTGTAEEEAAFYVGAFQRIAEIFDVVGASNVSFVWAPSTALVASPMEAFYPGDDYVDWIGADGYDRQQLGEDAFATQFGAWYEMFHGRGKPMMVAETGATTDQAAYLRGIADVLPTDFPEIKALIYFDAAGEIDWRLGSYGATGLSAFADLGRQPYFTAVPDP